MRMRFPRTGFAAALSLVVFATLFNGPESFANDPQPDEIVACDISGTDKRGSEVCFVEADTSLSRDGSPLVHGTDWGLFFQDESAVYGEGSAGFTVRIGMEDSGSIDAFTAPNAGDVLSAHIAYPVVDQPADPDNDIEGLRGTDLSAGAFAVTTAEDFSFSKSIETAGSDSWILFEIDMTFVTSWYREACTFGEFDETSGFSQPTPECETPNGSGNDSEALIGQDIAFYTPQTFDGFVNETTDGGYLNYQGTGVSWFTEASNFQFQLIGPRYASGTDRNSGALQAFLPEAAMRQIFGASFSPAEPTWNPQRKDVTDSGLQTEDLSNSVVTSERNGGLLISLASYEFSAPVFSFAAESDGSGSSDSNSSGEEKTGTPGIFLTVRGQVSESAAGSEITFGAFSVAPNSPFVLSIRDDSNGSERLLSSGAVSSDGHLERTLRLPLLSDGPYTITLVAQSRENTVLPLGNRLVVNQQGLIANLTPEAEQPNIR